MRQTWVRATRALSYAVRRRLPDKAVRRTVLGAELVLPRSHRLPDYVAVHPTYGRNIVELAATLATADGRRLQVLDVGANIGDTALQVLAATDARVLCVEADPYWLPWLHRNVDPDPRVVVNAGLVSVDAQQAVPVRVGGTTRFVAAESAESADSAPPVTAEALRAAHPEFHDVRLIKSDTDGYDVELGPALAAAWQDTRPVLFLEYDHGLSRVAGRDPQSLWRRLEQLGYASVGVWDNHGRPLGRVPLDEMSERARLLDAKSADWDYWDVAVVHRDDEAGETALREVLPGAW